jgi:hypothetical protein
VKGRDEGGEEGLEEELDEGAEEGLVVGVGVVLGGRVPVVVRGSGAVVTGVMVVDVGGV